MVDAFTFSSKFNTILSSMAIFVAIVAGVEERYVIGILSLFSYQTNSPDAPKVEISMSKSPSLSKSTVFTYLAIDFVVDTILFSNTSLPLFT